MGLLLTLLISVTPDGGSGLVPADITLRAVDDDGKPMKNIGALFFDQLHLSGKVTPLGCGTVHPQQDLFTGEDGAVHATLPFTPTHYEVGGVPDGYECVKCAGELHGAALELKLHRIPLETIDGAVVDDRGDGVEEAHVRGNYGDTASHVGGRFRLTWRTDRPLEVRVRKMGFKPVVVKKNQLMPVRLTVRRAFVTVKVIDPKTKLPSTTVRISLWKTDGEQSFCTTGADGICTLDSDPGKVELRVAGAPFKSLHIGTADLALTIQSPQPELGVPH